MYVWSPYIHTNRKSGIPLCPYHIDIDTFKNSKFDKDTHNAMITGSKINSLNFGELIFSWKINLIPQKKALKHISIDPKPNKWIKTPPKLDPRKPKGLKIFSVEEMLK